MYLLYDFVIFFCHHNKEMLKSYADDTKSPFHCRQSRTDPKTVCESSGSIANFVMSFALSKCQKNQTYFRDAYMLVQSKINGKIKDFNITSDIKHQIVIPSTSLLCV